MELDVNKGLIFLDTETTGNDVATDRLCEVCYRLDGATHTKRFKPPMPISVKAQSITHITNEMVADEEAFIGSAYATELQALLDTGIMVAHNAKFDIAMLESEGMRVPQHICTLRLVRYLDSEDAIPEYGLQYLRYHFGVSVDAAPHSAEGDVVALEAVFAHLYAMAAERAKTDDRETILKRMVDISAKPSLIRAFSFGKYKGQKLEDVAQSDPGYLRWLLAQKREDPEGEEDWLFTLEQLVG